MTVQGGDGNDTLGIDDAASANLDQIAAPITFDGGAGVDQVILRDFNNAFDDGWAVTASTADRDLWNGVLFYIQTENIRIEAGNGSNLFLVQSTSAIASYDIFGSGGNDVFQVGVNDWNAQIPTGSIVRFYGEAGPDTLDIQTDLPLTVGNSTIAVEGGGSVELLGIEQLNLDLSALTTPGTTIIENPPGTVGITGGSGDDLILVLSTSHPVTINAGAGNDTIEIGRGYQTVEEILGHITFNGGTGNDIMIINNRSNGGVAAEVYFEISSALVDRQSPSLFAGVSYATTETVRILGQGSSKGFLVASLGGKTALEIYTGAGDAAVVVGAGNADIDYTGVAPATSIEQYIRDGRLRKGVNGAFAVDAAAQIGMALSTDLFPPDAVFPQTFAGRPVDETALLLRYSRLGDANLDRTVGFDDLLTLAQSYNTAGKRWSQGNFDYDVARAVDFSDLLILAQNYNASLLTVEPTPRKPTTAADKRTRDTADLLT